MLYFGLFLIYFLSLINFNFVEVNEEIIISINICLFFLFFFLLIETNISKILTLERRITFFIFKYLFFLLFIKLDWSDIFGEKIKEDREMNSIYISLFSFTKYNLLNYIKFKLWFKKSLMLVVFKVISYWTLKIVNIKEKKYSQNVRNFKTLKKFNQLEIFFKNVTCNNNNFANIQLSCRRPLCITASQVLYPEPWNPKINTFVMWDEGLEKHMIGWFYDSMLRGCLEELKKLIKC